ncbi:DUF7662 domain-containing protein [Zavarzinia aquatilis]|uniref:DUF7662 domain-containing protein n=1 Tax=Zavarzinia aquatilis TaxID=2211142 RepID=A0A317E476_9PROT|nr:hypothetical protein [Zavarzinia aquatilis]PWR21441.1 hypothetical protein DKG74_13500 [Zavarzinia aquatilis]
MSKYSELSFHLARLDTSVWTASFDEISHILGFPLPSSAYNYPAWWANQTGVGHTQSLAWQSAGWKTTDLDLKGQRVTFRYCGGEESNLDKVPEPAAKPPSLTIAEAKAGLAQLFGVREDQIEITIRA